MSKLMRHCFFILFGATLLPIGEVHANESTLPSLELNRAVILDYNQRQHPEFWLAYDYFDQSMDYLNYASKTGTSTKLTQWTGLRGGLNINFDDNVRFRLQAEQGSQTLIRPVEPKSLNPKYWGADLRLQWNQRFSKSARWALETGYRMHKAPAYSASKFQVGNTLITAAPGKDLFSSSSNDSAWLVGAIGTLDINDSFTLHGNLEYRSVKVQAITTSYDPMVLATLRKQQIPQSSPWKEQHIILGAGMDWRLFSSFSINMDLRHYSISRQNYKPRTNFSDYNQNTVFDGYLNYNLTRQFSLYTHGQAATHFVLGDLPLLYNRRNNHTFKNPFGFVSIGLIYRL